jgi:hypothetical protein
MGVSDGLRVPVIPVMVELAVVGRAAQAAEVYVAEHLPRSLQHQRVSDLLEDDTWFFPARASGDGLALWQKGLLEWVGIPAHQGEPPVEETGGDSPELLYDVRRPVRVELGSRGALRGELLYSSQAGYDRPLDFLNRPERFFRLWTDRLLYLVNKVHVVCVCDQGTGAAES